MLLIYSGQACLDFLAREVKKTDPGESAHWQQFHKDFLFSGSEFQGIKGFGGCAPPHKGIQRAFHRLLQYRFREIGRRYEEFKNFDKYAREITNSQNRAVDLDVLRQVITLAFLKTRAPAQLVPTGTVCVIGDGFATMTTLLLASESAARVVLVNLNKTLLVDLWYLKLWLKPDHFEGRVSLLTNEQYVPVILNDKSASSKQSVVAIQAKNHNILQSFPIRLALNMVSMQEMNPQDIAGYFADIRAISRNSPVMFYCCNREEKTLPDGTKTEFSSYPWSADDEILIDELCPWHQQYYSVTPPFYRPYEGPIRHRLARMSPSA